LCHFVALASAANQTSLGETRHTAFDRRLIDAERARQCRIVMARRSPIASRFQQAEQCSRPRFGESQPLGGNEPGVVGGDAWNPLDVDQLGDELGQALSGCVDQIEEQLQLNASGARESSGNSKE
jgi:hypothetical protein